jgi:hypothetical protein
MTEETDPVSDGLRRAIAAADAANDAAEDIARLGKAQKEFVEQVGRAQKRSSGLATGATVGAVVCLALATLVYFRSVADLHEAAELQAEAAKLIAEEVLILKEAREAGQDHEDPVAKALEALPEAVATAVAARLAETAEEATPAAAGDVVAAIEESRDEVLSALAEMDLSGAAPAKQATVETQTEAAPPEGAAPTTPAAPNDLTDIRESLARIEAGLLRITAAPASPAKGAATAGKPAPATSGKSGGKPAPIATEPNPFAYP